LVSDAPHDALHDGTFNDAQRYNLLFSGSASPTRAAWDFQDNVYDEPLMQMQHGPNDPLLSDESTLCEQAGIHKPALYIEGIATPFHGAEDKRSYSVDQSESSPSTLACALPTLLASGTPCCNQPTSTHWASSLAGPEGVQQSPVNSRTKQSPLVRPLSAYNFFFQFERNRLLQHDVGDTTDSSPLPRECFAHYNLTVDNASDFQQRLLQQQWARDPTVKRKHVKSHGRISFSDLSKRISAGWRHLPESAKEVFYEIARQDLKRFTREKKIRAAQDSTQQFP
jgi:HMG-box domain